MKFAHTYEAVLRKDGFPAHWVQSAISYRQLKKCIKKVQKELGALGLDPDTLQHLCGSIEPEEPSRASSAIDRGSSTQILYSFTEGANCFQPKLILTVDPRNGIAVDAVLSAETVECLQNLVVSQRVSSSRQQLLLEEANTSMVLDNSPEERPKGTEQVGDVVSGFLQEESSEVHGDASEFQRIEVPLTSDLEFFHLLKTELSSLDELQASEQRHMTKEIVSLGSGISQVVAPSTRIPKTDLYTWRAIFELYVDCKIFFSTNEQDAGSRDFSKAQMQLAIFLDKLKQQSIVKKFKRKESRAALEEFIRINLDLLRNLRFQEINHTAMTKILKKFDKRTALGAKDVFPSLVATEFTFTKSVGKAICFEVSEKLLGIIPQLNDYLCPVCFSISYKPRAKERHCPLCRGLVVMEADSNNLDPQMIKFLEKYFPKEVEAKQKENRRAIGVDLYGEDFDKCIMM
ncbi:MAG: hypothetical protein M1827_000075 [Pycnora praestabilis]|nr:MAG: hypothetical protein M1827_000075 [Pycnora praestabilis]